MGTWNRVVLDRSASIAAACLCLQGCHSSPIPIRAPEPSSASMQAAPPATLTPAQGSGPEAVFTLTLDPAAERPARMGLLLSTIKDGHYACYASADLSDARLSLVDDEAGRARVLQGSAPVANSQCMLMPEGTEWRGRSLRIHFRFFPKFSGVKQIFLVTEPTGKPANLQPIGAWVVTP